MRGRRHHRQGQRGQRIHRPERQSSGSNRDGGKRRGGGGLRLARFAARLVDHRQRRIQGRTRELWKDIQRHGSEMDGLSRHWTIEQNKTDWKQAKPLLDELRSAQDKAEAIAHTIDEQPAAKILATEAAPLAKTHAAKGDRDHRRGRRHCLDRSAQEPVDRICRHARQHGDGDRCDPRLSLDRGHGLQEGVRGSLGAQSDKNSMRCRSGARR